MDKVPIDLFQLYQPLITTGYDTVGTKISMAGLLTNVCNTLDSEKAIIYLCYHFDKNNLFDGYI